MKDALQIAGLEGVLCLRPRRDGYRPTALPIAELLARVEEEVFGPTGRGTSPMTAT